METNNSGGSRDGGRGGGGGGGGGIDIGEGLVALAALGIAILVFFLVVYSIVLGLSAGAIYLGAMLGSNGRLGKKSRHQQVKELESQKQEDLSELSGESEELKSLVDSSSEQEKMELYRENDRPEPVFSINLDAVKTVAKKVTKKMMGKSK
jgi:uncharacterized membrane protein